MHPLLEECNRLLLEYDVFKQEWERLFAHPNRTDDMVIESLTLQHDKQYLSDQALVEYDEVIDQLSVSDIIVSYNDPTISRSLQGMLGAYMHHYFDEAYLPTMIKGVEDEDEAAYFYLHWIAKNVDQERLASVILLALDKSHPNLLTNAMFVAQEYKIIDAIPKIESLINHKRSDIVKLAVETLIVLNT